MFFGQPGMHADGDPVKIIVALAKWQRSRGSGKIEINMAGRQFALAPD